MKRINVLRPLVLAMLAVAPAAQAAVDLIAVGSIDGRYEDLATQTAGALESGTAGNRIGTGSGFAYAGGTTFLALPDRGPNAVAYNSAIDDTTSWIPRFHEINMSLAAADAGAALPFVLTPTLQKTTLLASPDPLVYAATGTPSINSAGMYYFSGRSDNFDAAQNSLNANNGRLDPEGIRVSNQGNEVFITDEYGPYVYKLNRKSGMRVHAYTLPSKFAVASPRAKETEELANNTSGRVTNKGMEGLAITPDGRFLVGIMQSPLLQDGGTSAPYTRIVMIHVGTGTIREYAYALTNIGTVSSPKYPTVSEILAISDTKFLVLERDGKGRGDGSSAVNKRLFSIDLTGAARVDNLVGAAALAPKAVAKTEFMNMVTKLGSYGYASTAVPAKLEGIAFGPDITHNGSTRHTLWLANDNDFLANVGGIENPNNFYVFAFDDADLPGYTAQAITPRPVDCR